MSEIETKPAEEATPPHLFDDVPQVKNASPIPVLPELSVALGLLVFVFSITFIGAKNTILPKAITDDFRVEKKIVSVDEAPQTPGFESISLDAQSVVVWDVQTQKVIYEKNADDQLPLASVAKLMTALVAYELLDPSDRVSIPLSALQVEGDSGFVDGEMFTMQDLVDLTLISSSNDGAAALSANAGNAVLPSNNPEEVFVTAMNLKAQELGLTKTYFENSTGLDLSPTQAGAYGSARDMSLLMEYIITHTDAAALTTLDLTTVNNVNGAYHLAKNTNEVVNDIDGLIASKTGYTELAGGNLVVAFDAGFNRPIIVTVLGSTQQGRFTDTLQLVEKTRAQLGSAK